MPDFIRNFERLVPPQTFNITTGPETADEIERRAEEWFAQVRDALGFQPARFDADFQVEHLASTKGFGYPTYHDTEWIQLRYSGLQTLATVHDEARPLKEEGEILANVLDERDMFNHHVVSFLKHHLRPGLDETILGIHRQMLDHPEQLGK